MILGTAIGVMFVLQLLCLAGLWWSTTELKAMQKSTHSIQFMPADAGFQKLTEETKTSLTKDIFENLG